MSTIYAHFYAAANNGQLAGPPAPLNLPDSPEVRCLPGFIVEVKNPHGEFAVSVCASAATLSIVAKASAMMRRRRPNATGKRGGRGGARAGTVSVVPAGQSAHEDCELCMDRTCKSAIVHRGSTTCGPGAQISRASGARRRGASG